MRTKYPKGPVFQAYMKGYLAYVHEDPAYDPPCPYRSNRAYAWAWERGWHDALNDVWGEFEEAVPT